VGNLSRKTLAEAGSIVPDSLHKQGMSFAYTYKRRAKLGAMEVLTMMRKKTENESALLSALKSKGNTPHFDSLLRSKPCWDAPYIFKDNPFLILICRIKNSLMIINV